MSSAKESKRNIIAVAIALAAVGHGAAYAMPTVDAVTPAAQRVHERVVLRGSGFGAYQPGVSRVDFSAAGGGSTTRAGVPYVWRDDYIAVRVPAGDANGAVPKGNVEVTITNADGTSNAIAMEVLFRPGAGIDLFEKTRLVNDEDTSGFLGAASFNQARTKDAEIGDVNGDGYPDIIDNNSNNVNNRTHEVIRTNRLGLYFTPTNWAPRTSGDTEGPFRVIVPPDGVYVGDAIVYDADFVDLNNDDLPDWVQAASVGRGAIRVSINNFNGNPGLFLESTNQWVQSDNFPSSSPDDIGHTDVNFDGFVDVLAAFRFSSSGQVFLNQNGTTFGTVITATAQSGSMHDAFFTDFDGDGYNDVVLVNENGNSARFRNNQSLPVPSFVFVGTLPENGFAGATADFNADGLDDLVIGGSFSATVFLNDPNSPGTFTLQPLPGVEQFTYDIELADMDLDGDVDIIATAVVTNPNDNLRMWLNDGNGNFTNVTTPGSETIFPDNGPYQRMSADVIDMDNDGDLDIYVTGADGTGVFGFGAVTNQFWENRAIGLALEPRGNCPGQVTLVGSGATPGAQVAVLRGSALFAREVMVGPCPTLRLGLQGISLLTVQTADAEGNFSFTTPVPGQFCGAFVQALEFASCATSSVDSLP
jgi:hypothetical protein